MYFPVKTCVMLFCVWTYELMLFLRSGYVQAQTDFVGVGERFCVGCFCCQSDYSDILGLRYTMTMDSYHTMCICYLRYWIILCYCWNTDWDYHCVLWYCKKCFPTWLLYCENLIPLQHQSAQTRLEQLLWHTQHLLHIWISNSGHKHTTWTWHDTYCRYGTYDTHRYKRRICRKCKIPAVRADLFCPLFKLFLNSSSSSTQPFSFSLQFLLLLSHYPISFSSSFLL